MGLLEALKETTNYTYTENGALAHKSTNDVVYDFFALAGGMRSTPSQALSYFKDAWFENRELALKALFWLRDCRGGQGERDIFRLCFTWLLNTTKAVHHLIPLIPTYGRWDDLIIILDAQSDRTLERGIYQGLIYKQLIADLESDHPSLLAKWMKSINTSSAESRRLAKKAAFFLGLSKKEYRKMLSTLRKRINIVEQHMSANKWDEINFEQVPSGANLLYKNCFLTREETTERYQEFIKDDTKEIHAGTLYPYQIVEKMLESGYSFSYESMSDKALNKLWDNLPDYFDGNARNILCVVDTSGSMAGRPLNVAIALGTYAAQRTQGYFHNHYITFASEPRLIKLKGDNTAEQVRQIRDNCLIDNTNLSAVFELLLTTADLHHLTQDDMPEAIVVISDMQIDCATGGNGFWSRSGKRWTARSADTEMEAIRKIWEIHGYKLPHLVYWNVNAAKPVILDSGDNVTFVSGYAPTHFKAICAGKGGKDLMLDTLLDERYAPIALQ